MTREGYSNFPKEQLADIFDRICQNEIKTDTLKSEKAYNRLGSFFAKESNHELFLNGEIFLKYGKKGDPHKRLVYFDENHDNLIWSKENKTNIRKIPTSEIHEVKPGVTTSKVLVKNKVD